MITFRSSEIFPGSLNRVDSSFVFDFHYSEQTDGSLSIKYLMPSIQCRLIMVEPQNNFLELENTFFFRKFFQALKSCNGHFDHNYSHIS
jgi:hypothetical protein